MSNSTRSACGVGPGEGPLRLAAAAAPDTAYGPLSGDASASVTGYDGTVIATVQRQVVAAGADLPGPVVVVAVDGDIDQDTAPLVQAVLTQALESGDRVRLDLAGVRFFGAAGVSVVLTIRRLAVSGGRSFELSGAHGLAERVLAVTGALDPSRS